MTGFKNGMYYSNMHVSVCTHALRRSCNNQSENWNSVKSEGWKPRASSQKPGYCSTCHRDTHGSKPRTVYHLSEAHTKLNTYKKNIPACI